MFSGIEIKSSSQIIEYCRFLYDLKLGQNLYLSYPYLLAMDDNNTTLYELKGNTVFKNLKLLHKFYETQMKIGRPTYFSPDFMHRLYIDQNSKEVVLNYTITNINILKTNITS